VIGGPAAWDHMERHGTDLLVGLDVPLLLGRVRLAPGFAAGGGTLFTRDHTESAHFGTETNGLRANVHLTLTVPIAHRFALDVFAAGDLTQATRIEDHGDVHLQTGETPVMFPAEPRALVRVGIGIRYGGL
jgi:hypothetical protein